MYDNSRKPPIGSSKLLIVLVIAIIVVILGTVLLNGGLSPSAPVNDSVNNSSVEEPSPSTQYKLLGNNSYGTVTKISGIGNPSSDIKVALIAGVDQKQQSANSIVSTLKDNDMLNYCYDIYIINTTSSSKTNDDENNSNNLTVNEMSEALASEFAVPDIINTNYNFTVDIHSTNDSNSYLFVPSDNTYTSKVLVDYISNTTNVGKYTPDTHPFTEEISEKIISYEIPSIVYVTKEYYGNGTSTEINSVIGAIDNFDFIEFFNPTSDVSNYQQSSNDSYNNNSSNTDEYTVVVSNSSGNKEVN